MNTGGSNLFGKIRIGDNCFIGSNTLLFYGTELADNIIVAAGSVVCNTFNESNIIIGGNPARKIGTWDSFYENSAKKSINRSKAKQLYDMNDTSFLIKRSIKQ